MTTEFEQRLKDAIQGHKHPDLVTVTENDLAYGPRVKLTCKACPGETYVPRNRPAWDTDAQDDADDVPTGGAE